MNLRRKKNSILLTKQLKLLKKLIFHNFNNMEMEILLAYRMKIIMEMVIKII